ncbi:hypothetical protein NP493_547g01069 [Ridgeia piscesae]|uniref:Uncharacterized protein n=1 Tax=Ridgeia piscesae TaxID=27915 RepID=A0AAD9NRW8_RIDPI|nr:hypothetical protein NP493_547g01069 [Ridgeia piscesae]
MSDTGIAPMATLCGPVASSPKRTTSSRMPRLWVVLVPLVLLGHFTLWHLVHNGGTRPLTEVDRERDWFVVTQKPLLVLLTTFTRDLGKAYIQTNILRNWALLRPVVQPVLYSTYDDGPLIEFAKQLGWHVLHAHNVTEFNAPYVKGIYESAMDVYDAPFYGYCNGDILFDSSIVKTLREVERRLYALNTTMVTGRRINVKMNLSIVTPLFQLSDVTDKARKGTIIRPYAEDYFFVTRDFPWHVVPDVVIGRPAYDNFLVAIAIKQNVSVIDATKTLLAFHQTGVDGNRAGHHRTGADYNLKVIKKAYGTFSYKQGWTTQAPYEMERDIFGNVFIQVRPPKPAVTKPAPVSKKAVAKLPEKTAAKRPETVVAKAGGQVVSKTPANVVAMAKDKVVAKIPDKGVVKAAVKIAVGEQEKFKQTPVPK